MSQSSSVETSPGTCTHVRESIFSSPKSEHFSKTRNQFFPKFCSNPKKEISNLSLKDVFDFVFAKLFAANFIFLRFAKSAITVNIKSNSSFC